MTGCYCIIIDLLCWQVFVPIFEDTAMSIPFSCPLSPSRNVYGDNEKHKLWEDTSRWSCQYCGKAFFGQEYLDMHFENRHLETINQVQQQFLALLGNGWCCKFLTCNLEVTVANIYCVCCFLQVLYF